MMRLKTMLAALALVGCVGTEVGNPPFDPEMPGDPVVGRSISAHEDPRLLGAVLVRLPDGPPMVGGRSASVSVVNLESDEESVEMRQSDGAFQVAVGVRRGDVIRLHFANAAPPEDFVVDGLSVTPEVDPFDGCLRREFRVVRASADELIDLRYRNDCGRPLQLTPSFRRGAGWQLANSNTTVDVGEVVTFEVIAGEGLGEDTFFVFVRDGERSHRYATSLLPR